jgi:coiled-coil domain-containing protein 130
MQTQWKDDFALNQMLRKKFRQEKKVIVQKEEKDQEIKDKGGLDLDLVNEDPDDVQHAKNIRFRAEGKSTVFSTVTHGKYDIWT